MTGRARAASGRDRPVDRPVRCRRASPDRARRAAASRRGGRPSTADSAEARRRPARALMTRQRHVAVVRGVLVAVELHARRARHRAAIVAHVGRRCVDEHADARHERRQRRRRSRAAVRGVDGARAARPEHEPDAPRRRARPPARASSRARDAADLDARRSRAPLASAALPYRTQRRQRRAGIGLRDQPLADQERVVAGAPQPREVVARSRSPLSATAIDARRQQRREPLEHVADRPPASAGCGC